MLQRQKLLAIFFQEFAAIFKREASVALRQQREEKHGALSRPAVHFGDKTSIPRAAFLAETGVGASVELVPERARFRQRCQLRPVARLRVLLPCSNRAVVLDFIQAAEDRRISKIVEFFSAKIIVAAFHVADAQLALAIRKERLL